MTAVYTRKPGGLDNPVSKVRAGPDSPGIRPALFLNLEHTTMNPYTENGYDSRQDYLESLAEDYGIELGTVKMLADLLGPSEDFDGLVTNLQDYEATL